MSSIPGKVFARILINARPNSFVEQTGEIPEFQKGFTAGRSAMNIVFSFLVIMKVAGLKQLPVHFVFVDLVKAYDCVGWCS